MCKSGFKTGLHCFFPVNLKELGMNESQSPPLPTATPVQPRTSIAAIWSLVLGILSFCLSIFAFIPALILGIVALVKINGSEGRLQGKGLAIAGIVSGTIGVIFGTAVLASIMIPAVVGVQREANSVMEVNNIRQLTMGCMMYEVAKGGKFPEKLQDLFPDYIDDETLLKATDSKTKETRDYIYFPVQTEVSKEYLPLIASPFVHNGKRAVGMCSGAALIMDEEEYQKVLKYE